MRILWRERRQAIDAYEELVLSNPVSGDLLLNVIDITAPNGNMSHSYQMEGVQSQSDFRRDEANAIVQQLQQSRDSRITGEQPRA